MQYVSSNGTVHEIATMPFPYLRNATLVAEKFHAGTKVTLALRVELDRRDAEYEAATKDNRSA
jgi:hypothetical protein